MAALDEEFDALVAHPGVGRSFQRTVVPGLGDAAPGGRVRLDAIARWLQDVAHADVRDAGLADGAVWVVRRARMQVRRFPRFDEPATLDTFSSGLGRMWAQRRTTVTTAEGGHVEAVALWVHLDPAGGRPVPLTKDELAVYGASAAGREVKARLRHPGPPPTAAVGAWRFRATELDLAGHINNAAYWAPLEEELVTAGREPERLDVELEFRAPSQPGEFAVVRDGPRRWIVAPGGVVHASAAIRGLDTFN
jgi:acyl-ACP thioesterase